MKVWQVGDGPRIEDLAMHERDIPVPGKGEVLVRMRAVSLNYRDLTILNGQYSFRRRPGNVPVSDGAGEVVALGDGVHRVQQGDRVAGIFFPRWIAGRVNAYVLGDQPGSMRDGMLAQYVVFSQDAVVPIPPHMSFEEASTLPCAGSTAWVSLTGGERPLLAGDVVLTLGSGGVSLMALQIARLFGATVVATTSDDAKAARLRELGAHHVINYRQEPEWQEAVKRVTHGAGADHVIEVGGSGTLERSLASASVGGVVNMIGFLQTSPQIDGSLIMANNAHIRRIRVGSRADLEALCRALAAHQVKPVIDRVFAFDQVHAAYRHFESRNFMGKVVISI